MGQRVLIAAKHRVFSQGLQEMLSREREVEHIEIAPADSDIAAIVRQQRIDTVIVDSGDSSGSDAREFPFFEQSPELRVIVVRPDQSSMYSYRKRAVMNADFTSLLAEVKGSPGTSLAKRTNATLSHGSATAAIVSALEIIRSAGEIGLVPLGEKLGLSRAEARSLVNVLELNGYLSRTPDTKKYSLGLKLFEMGSAAVSRLGLREIALPIMERLGEATGENIHLGVLDNDRRVVVYIEQIDSPLPVRYLGVGSVAPAHCGAVGKAILAYQSPEVVARYCSLGLEVVTPMTICDIDALDEELEMVRQNGYSLCREEWHEGIFGLGAPIRDHKGHVSAGISVNGLVVRFTPDRIERYKTLLLEAAAEISTRLGYREGFVDGSARAPGRSNG